MRLYVVPLLDMRKEVIQTDNCIPEIIRSHFDAMISRGIIERVPPIRCDSIGKLATSGGGGSGDDEKRNTSIRDVTTVKRKLYSLCEDEVSVCRCLIISIV